MPINNAEVLERIAQEIERIPDDRVVALLLNSGRLQAFASFSIYMADLSQRMNWKQWPGSNKPFSPEYIRYLQNQFKWFTATAERIGRYLDGIHISQELSAEVKLRELWQSILDYGNQAHDLGAVGTTDAYSLDHKLDMEAELAICKQLLAAKFSEVFGWSVTPQIINNEQEWVFAPHPSTLTLSSKLG